MKFTVIKAILLLFIVASLQAKEVYNLDQLIKQALEKSPDLQIKMKEYEASRKRTDKMFGYYLPKVDIHAAAGEISSGDIPIFPNYKQQETLLMGTVSLKQLIYDFGKTGGSFESSKYMQESYSMNNLQSISDKIREVKSAYYDVLRAMALMNVAQENLKLNESQLYRAKKYYAAGIRTKIDISDAKVNVIQAQIDLKKVHYKRKLAYGNLDKVIGITDIETPYVIQEQKLNLDDIFATLTPYDMDLKDSVAYAYEHRYSIKQLSSTLKASSQNIRTAQSEYFPSLYASVNYTRQELSDPKTILPQTQWQALVNLDWNLYQGGSSSANIEEKRIQEQISEAKLEFLKLQIKKDVTEAYLNLNESKDRVELSEALLRASIEKFNQAQKRYANGLSDYIELQQARQSYIDAKSSLVIDYYNYYDALARMYNVIGM
ncbi:TolC family protein [Sulfurimonas indica]|uniref:TolC family protein n=1 Tax=Sulfurimonas indica TaxID=2508707 RepID=UPI0012630ADC|nr:TolC family protein [Sulfurimonas indica]